MWRLGWLGFREMGFREMGFREMEVGLEWEVASAEIGSQLGSWYVQ
jgi:hypothetical protein